MSRLLILAYLTATTATLIVATPVNARKDHHKTTLFCNTHRKQTITADSQAILYRNTKPFEPSTVYGCAFTRGRSYELGEYPTEGSCSPSGCVHIHHATLTGPFAAYEYFSTDGESESKFLIVVRDLRDDRIIHRVPTGTPVPPESGVVGNGFAAAIVLKSNGAVAWINEYPTGVDTDNEVTHYELHALDKTGNRLLATGTNIDPHSLALAGSTLYWTQASQPHSTRLN